MLTTIHGQVPLQYSDLTTGEAQIAILMSPSNFSRDDSRYLGPVLFNQGERTLRWSASNISSHVWSLGGPGDSGVEFVSENAEVFRAYVGPQYDLVGFDPRGTMHHIIPTWS